MRSVSSAASSSPAARRGPAPLSLAALALVSLGLAAAPARAQTQDLFVSNDNTNTISRFAGTGPGTFSTTATTLSGGLNLSRGLAVDARGDLFAANAGNKTIENKSGDCRLQATGECLPAEQDFILSAEVPAPSGRRLSYPAFIRTPFRVH